MGKARIVGGGADGLYQIEIAEDRTRAEANKALAEARIVEIATEIDAENIKLSAAQAKLAAAADVQNAAIAQYQAELAAGETPSTDITQPAEAMMQAAAQRDGIARRIKALEAEKTSLENRVAQLDSPPPLRQMDAWCADLVEDLSGEVATAEVPGEVGSVVIQPGFSDGAAWSATKDGMIQPALSGTPASVFYNLAMMPGWQKWRPTFRFATVSNISNDLCDIALEPATSSQQGLGVNAQSHYSGVAIMYMDCNGEAFEEGDRALVAFSGNTGTPMVVGFASDPKPCTCCIPRILVMPALAHERPESTAVIPGTVYQGAGENAYIRRKNRNFTEKQAQLDPTYDANGNMERCRGAIPEGYSDGAESWTPVSESVIASYVVSPELGVGDLFEITIPPGIPLGWFEVGILSQAGNFFSVDVCLNHSGGECLESVPGITGSFDESGNPIGYSGGVTLLLDYYGEYGTTVNITMRSGPRARNHVIEIGCKNQSTGVIEWPSDSVDIPWVPGEAH